MDEFLMLDFTEILGVLYMWVVMLHLSLCAFLVASVYYPAQRLQFWKERMGRSDLKHCRIDFYVCKGSLYFFFKHPSFTMLFTLYVYFMV